MGTEQTADRDWRENIALFVHFTKITTFTEESL